MLLCLLPILAVAPSPAGADAGEPLHALETIQRAVDESDSDLFTQAADLDSMLNSASDTLMASLKQQAAAGNLGDSNFAMALALVGMAEDSGQGALIKQLMLSEVKGFVVSGLNGGYFAGKPNGRVRPPRASLASTLDKMPQGRREIVPGKVLTNEDGKATVSAIFVDPEAGRLPLVLGLKKQNEHWRVVEIVNAAELFEKAGKAR